MKLLAFILLATSLFTASVLWECNYCHQQYIGNSPPPFIKCPAKDNKINHWWIRKSR
jgi:hypothetical protein